MQSDPLRVSPATPPAPADPQPDATSEAPSNGRSTPGVPPAIPPGRTALPEQETAAPDGGRADLPESATAPTQDPAVAPEPVAPEPAYSPLRYWLRPLVLSVLVVFLLGLTYLDQHRVPDRPVAPDVQLATPPAGSTVSASDPGLLDTLARLRTALQRRDARGLANLSDPDGLIVAAYSGAVPDSGYTVPGADMARFSQDLLNGAQVSLPGWRNDGRGRVVILADGFKQRALRLSPNSTLEVSSLTGIGLANRAGTWYVRWILPDPNGVLAQQARSLVWQPLPNG